ncbi:hypothetical protein L3073_07130 [Ancylomarina sp. DW003]|nr:hypothetical protein [Ancylomarina sp. DW003]MDE5421977.1 hypothetical protein [Ancylomarina sp. DW003]
MNKDTTFNLKNFSVLVFSSLPINQLCIILFQNKTFCSGHYNKAIPYFDYSSRGTTTTTVIDARP